MFTTSIRSITFCDLDDGATYIYKDKDTFGFGSLFSGTLKDVADGLYIAWELEPMNHDWKNELSQKGETLFSYHGATKEIVRKVTDTYFTVQAI